MSIEGIVGAIFGFGLFINAALFIPQVVKLFRTKDASELSLLTFGGFNLIQIFMIWHGYLQHDGILIWGGVASFITCGAVTAMILIYKK